jgi:NADPH-dependent 2,4-dienoyl-CoA reductase/sulfur reductase-like enzyme
MEPYIDAFRINIVNMENYHKMFPSMGTPLGINIPLGKMLKDRLKTAKVMLGQRINDPDLAEKALQEGAADFVLLGRALLCDPYFPKKASQGKKKSIRRCVGCNHCADRLAYGKSIRCMLNPVLGFEQYYTQIQQTTEPKSVLVIGGGVAGMEAARVAAEKGHKVTLAEKSEVLGGQLKYATAAPFKEELGNIVEYYQHELDTLGVDVRFKTLVDTESIKNLNADVVILATGADALIPSIPGVGNKNVRTAQDILDNTDLIRNQSVAVIGGGSVGAEVAEILALRKNKVTIIEKKSAIAEDLGLIIALDFHDRLDELPIEKLIDSTVERIEDDRVFYKKNSGETGSIIADTVVLAAGYISNRRLESVLEELSSDFVMIGDCVSPRKIVDAIHEGFHAARVIE